MTDALGSPVETIEKIAAEHFDRDGLVLRHGGGGAATQLVGGFFSFEGSPLPAVMSALPPLIHIPRGDAGAPPWLAAISRFLLAEAQEPNPGSSLMISRLIDLLVIRTLRSWAASEANRMGWLGGLGEERIGRVLSAMHADPFHRWTVHSLAAIARMSRSIFADRGGSAAQRRTEGDRSGLPERICLGRGLQPGVQGALRLRAERSPAPAAFMRRRAEHARSAKASKIRTIHHAIRRPGHG
jgi:hypothetical protein